jgi:hypothetical protein
MAVPAKSGKARRALKVGFFMGRWVTDVLALKLSGRQPNIWLVSKIETD